MVYGIAKTVNTSHKDYKNKSAGENMIDGETRLERE